jgi:hypothetical protein
MALGQPSSGCDLREQARRPRQTLDALQLPSERRAAVQLTGLIYHENRAGLCIDMYPGNARSSAPIRATGVKRAWVIGSAAFTVSRGWA